MERLLVIQTYDLRIATWNANSLLNRCEEIQVFLDTKKIDVCLISGTHFTNQSYLKIRGYKVYNRVHPQNRGREGSDIIIKDSINHYEEQHLQSEEIQLTMVGIKSTKQKLLVGALYCPPKHNLKKMDYRNVLQHLGDRFNVGGHYNAKHTDWGATLITMKEKN